MDGQPEPLLFVIAYTFTQLLYLLSMGIDLYFFSLPTNWVDMSEAKDLKEGDYPFIILFYPVLKEMESTMRTTFQSLEKVEYPRDRFKVISIPNANDLETIQSLENLQKEFSFLEILQVPSISDESWNLVWDAWEKNPKAYWWHVGKYAKRKDLPPKKTRQLIYAFYHVAKQFEGKEDFLVNYIDADSCIPTDHFLAGAVGIRHYDVLQATNIAGNLNATWAASFHAFDHLQWDIRKYPHLSANGKHPFWVLGKALFYKGSDLLFVGSFHPWIAIEDPEVGMRLWMNGKKLGIINKPVIEEVPCTFHRGIVQRKRWVCGFFQTLTEPLTRLGMTPYQKFLSWLNFIPCLSLWVNSIGLPIGIWQLILWLEGRGGLPLWIIVLSIFNISLYFLLLISLYISVWKNTALVLNSWTARLWYIIRINPLFSLFWGLFWLIPIWIGYRMYAGEGGLVWDRTQKVDANAKLFKNNFLSWFKRK